jgi:hypothetical protein
MFFIIAFPQKLVKLLKFFSLTLDKSGLRMYNNFSAPRVKAYLRAPCSHAKTTSNTLQLILKIIPIDYKDL